MTDEFINTIKQKYITNHVKYKFLKNSSKHI